MKRQYAYAAMAVLAMAALLQSCGNAKNSDGSDTTDPQELEIVEETPAAEGDSLFQATVDFFQDAARKGNGLDSTYVETPSGLKYRVLKEGTGKSPIATDNVTVHYEGRLLNGTKFDSSYDRGEAATFPLNQVIKGWTEGLQTMKEGGVTEFYIPSEIAYGETGTPGGPIPPNAPLIFKVELIKVN